MIKAGGELLLIIGFEKVYSHAQTHFFYPIEKRF